MQCPHCNLENADNALYCERCGTLLRRQSHATPYSEYGMQHSSSHSITIFRVIRSILYFMAAIVAAFGLIGTFNGLFGTDVRAEGIAIFFGIGVLVASVVVFLRLRHRSPELHWVQFIWFLLGITVGMFMAFVLAFALAPNGKLSDLAFGFILLLYGFLVAAMCLW